VFDSLFDVNSLYDFDSVSTQAWDLRSKFKLLA
jgi:hypothetical protein